MTKFCESCHTANRDRARYCRGCAGKFSGIRTPAHAFAGVPAEEWAPSTAPVVVKPVPRPVPARVPFTMPGSGFVAPRARETREPASPVVVPGGIDAPVVLLLMAVFLSIAAFGYWYWDRTEERSLAPPGEAAALHEPRPAPVVAESVANPQPAPPPVAAEPAPAQPAETLAAAPEPAPEPTPAPATPPTAASVQQPAPDAPVRLE